MSGHPDRSVQKIFRRTGRVSRPGPGLGADNAWRSPLSSSRARCASRRSTSSTTVTAARAASCYGAPSRAPTAPPRRRRRPVTGIPRTPDRAIGGHPGADLVADLAAIDGSFGILAGEGAFAQGADERMSYLERLADA